MKRIGCDIYGYPVYELQENPYVIQSPDGKISVVITATGERDAGQQFMELLSMVMNEGIYIRKVQ